VGDNLLGSSIAMIYLNNLVIGYQGKRLTQPISGQFEEGSLTAVMGENGTGKSTLLKTLCGLQPALSGRVLFKEDAQSKMAWLPQQADIDKGFPINVFDVVAMGCWPERRITFSLQHHDMDRIYAALNAVGIENLANVSISQLSGGQFQRMLFARLLVQNASIMLMDEPFTGIDSQTQDMLMALICQLSHEGKTMIAVLHNPNLVSDFFPQTLMINNTCTHWGKTPEVFTECQLFNQPQSHRRVRFG